MSERRIWLCADDYGISPGVNTGIRDLVVRGRLNATSVMVVAPSFDKSETAALAMLNAGSEKHVAVGLHVTLTGPFRPLSPGFKPLHDDAFLPVNDLLKRALTRRLRRETYAIEIAMQIKAFVERFGRAPDFVDGHQHVQLFPQIRDAFIDIVKQAAPQAWVRQCGRVVPLHRRLHDRKALILDILSSGFRERAEQAGLRTNPAFAGTYDFTRDADFAALFPRFLDRLPDGGLIMCHPGFVDPELQRLDPLTDLREREYAYFGSPAFPALLAANGVSLAAPD
jgi:predicted glycoside hydrolase/deacetylase ChbG (UPF0249 family)